VRHVQDGQSVGKLRRSPQHVIDNSRIDHHRSLCAPRELGE
jgi:hypothetical protein